MKLSFAALCAAVVMPALVMAYQMGFELYDAATGGTLVGSLPAGSVAVTGGRFSVDLGALFANSSSDAWLSIGCRERMA